MTYVQYFEVTSSKCSGWGRTERSNWLSWCLPLCKRGICIFRCI